MFLPMWSLEQGIEGIQGRMLSVRNLPVLEERDGTSMGRCWMTRQVAARVETRQVVYKPIERKLPLSYCYLPTIAIH